jgi:hypothetical protein
MKNNFFKLSRKKIEYLFIYFTILLFIGIALSILTLNFESIKDKLTITSFSIIGGIGTALIGSTIFYLRKLYKSSIKSLLSQPQSEQDNINEIGLFIYYFLRPIFAICFSLLIHIGLKVNVSIVSVKEADIEPGLIYLTMLLSFFMGFASGDVITKLESVSKDISEKFIDNIK